jgi:hypothetical protein
MDIQVIITDAIVAVAAYFVAKRVWDQLAALRKPNGKDGSSVCDTCGGCEPAKRQSNQALIGLSATAPRRVPVRRDSLPEHLQRMAGEQPSDSAPKN